MSQPPTQHSRAADAGPALAIGLISLALMSTEIVLTRLFSVVLWYHFAFFAISVALLGMGAGAVLVYALRERLARRGAAGLLSAGALAVGASVLALDLVLLSITPDWFGTGNSAFFTTITLKLLAVFAVTTAPFLTGGFVVSLTFARHGAAIHRLYAWDLVGAGLACALVIPMLDVLGGPHALVACAALAAVAALAFAAASEPGRARRLSLVAPLSLLLAGGGVAAAATGALQIRVAKGIDLRVAQPELNRWNSFSLITVFPVWDFRGWGTSPAYQGPIPLQKGLVIDMNAFTPLTPFDGHFESVQHTRHDLSAFAFAVAGDVERACIVGAGGGKDVLAALAGGAEHVTGVEVNPLIVRDVMLGRFREFTGGLYARDDVDIHVEDGRSFLAGDDTRYDVILISMVDTSAATAAGAFALAENTLYTTDAFRDFYGSLADDGILTVSSVSLEGLAVGARLASLSRQSLGERGEALSRSVAVLRTPWLAVAGATMHNFLVKPAGFSDAELSRISAAADAARFGVVHLHGRPPPAEQTPEGRWIRRILTEPDDAALSRAMAGWPLDVSPVDDDRPYFFYQNRLRDAGEALFSGTAPHLFGNGLRILMKVLGAGLLMLLLLIGLPLWMTRKRLSERERLGSDLGYVACLGLGFMFLELGYIQRLLGYLGQPTYTLTAVLAVLLVGGGVGSRLSRTLPAGAVSRVLLALLGYAALLAAAWPALADATMALPAPARAAVAGAALLPLGLMLGVPLPSGLSRVSARHDERIAWLWGVNSATSVLGSVLATVVSMHFGITVSLLTGMALYACAATLWPRVAR